jgi:uncharacterized protein YneF (UPF0154 family)
MWLKQNTLPHSLPIGLCLLFGVIGRFSGHVTLLKIGSAEIANNVKLVNKKMIQLLMPANGHLINSKGIMRRLNVLIVENPSRI